MGPPSDRHMSYTSLIGFNPRRLKAPERGWAPSQRGTINPNHFQIKKSKLRGTIKVKIIKVGVQKHWWSPELDDMKQQCIDITNLWNYAGRPRSGDINAERLRCKFRYKQAIKEAAKEADRNLNDDLYNHLCEKDYINFWKSWRKRFCSLT